MPKRAEIEELAYPLWEPEGKPPGQESAYMLETERLIEDMESEICKERYYFRNGFEGLPGEPKRLGRR